MTHDGYAVLDGGGTIRWYTIRPTEPESVNVFCGAVGVAWEWAVAAGYECRPVRLTERGGDEPPLPRHHR